MDNIRHLISSNIFGNDHGTATQQNGCSSSINSNLLDTEPVAISTKSLKVDGSKPTIAGDISSPEDDITFVDDDQKKKNRISIDSTYELLDYNSPEEVIEDGWSTVNRSGDIRTATGDGIKKKCEKDSIDERDTHSPPASPIIPNESAAFSVNSTILSPEAVCAEEENSKSFRRAQFSGDNTRPSSKEEKQRQNEEIVIMESSSVSSETGSWESVFPQHSPLELKEYCKLFLLNERKHSLLTKKVICQKIPPVEKKSPEDLCPYSSKASSGACFIDASSLYDDTEVMFPTDGPKLPDVACCGPHPSNRDKEKSPTAGCGSDTTRVDCDKSSWLPTNKSDSLNVKRSPGSKTTTPDMTSPNLSDEQKLLHRDCEQRAEYDIKDQYSSDSSTDQKIFTSYGDADSDRASHGSNEETDTKVRQNQERKQGHFLFKNSIQHFSGHVMNSRNSFSDREENGADYSLPSMQSNASDAPNESSTFETGSMPNSSFNDFGGHLFPYTRTFSESESVFYPDTPHNSIINVDSPRCSSRNSDSMHTSSQEVGIRIPKRVKKCDESAPILSGGVSVEDFTPKQCSSPSVVRRSEACPIICTAALPSDFLEENKLKKADKPKNLALNSWVVDMSDCTNSKSKRQRSESSSSSTENTTASKSLDQNSFSHKNGLGFYVSLEDAKPSKRSSDESSKENSSKTMTESLNEQKKMSTGFYVNLSDDEHKSTSAVAKVEEPAKNGDANKKNIFSMFIDFGEKSMSPKGPSSFPPRLSSSLQKESTLSQSDSDNASMSDSNPREFSGRPDIVRRSLSSSGNNTMKRHSWNTSKDRSERNGAEHSRSASMSGDKNVIMNILDKVPHLSKTSSMSIDSPNSPYDDFTCSKSLGSYSNNSNSLTSISIHSSVEKPNPENPAAMTASARRRQKDAKINETFDKSSQGSLTDGILSKDSSPTTDTDDVTFQNDPDQAGPSTMMETITEQVETASPKKFHPSKIPAAKIETHTMETLQATIEKQKQLLETVSEEVQLSSFVKLSDMDKPIQKFELHAEENLSKSVGSSRIGRLFVETKMNAPRNANMSRSTGTNLTNLASSVENLRSLTRLFPHLSKELSSSLPADIQTDDFMKKSPSSECAQLDILSCTSSLTSSFSRSGIDSADESSLSCRQPRRLGEDLLKMFLQEIATDVIIEVGGRRMRAHKCILRSRCQYFAAILAGGWVQSAGNVISIPGYSYGSVHFALCHIYSGAAHPPDGISLMELAALADLLGLEGLKEVTAHALRTNYCHNFHKPCSGCIDGILQVFPITLNHGLDDLYRKCLRWTCKYFAKVWPTRAFAQLPTDIIGRCKQHVVAHLTSETVLSTILEFDQLISLLAPCRWAVGVENTVRDIIDIAHSYISDHFANLLASDGFLSLGHGQSWNISRLENILLRIGSTLTPEQACKSYQRVTRLNAVLAAKVIKIPSPGMHIHDEFGDDEEEMDWNPEFIRLVGSILSAVEQCLTRQCARAMKNSQWIHMDAELRTKIQKLACLSDPVEMRNAKSKPFNYNLSMNNNRNQSLHQIKLAMRAHTTKPVANNQYRATAHTQTTHSDCTSETIDRSVQANNESRSNMVFKSSSAVHVPDVVPSMKIRTIEKPTLFGHRRTQSETLATTKIAKPTAVASLANCKTIPEKPKTPKMSDIKPRYLEPRTQRATAAKVQAKPIAKGKNISSSESSRNSSPAPNKRGLSRINPNDSKNMSRDSLASPAKQSKSLKHKNCPADFDMSIDSLGDSLKSSIKTDKTLSQESLIKCAPKPFKENLLKPSSRSNSLGNRDVAAKNALNKNRSSSCQTTNENSPASATTKSSRISSITSTVSSPRDGYRGRQAATAAASANSSTQSAVRKSFLSAKSKEILAKKQTLNQSESTKSIPSVFKERAAIPVNKSSSTSNMFSRRPNPFSTTLHLRRTAKLNETPLQPPVTHAANMTNGKKINPASDNRHSKLKTMKKPVKITVEIEDRHEGSSPPSSCQMKIESKLERSSTFCKESSDIPGGALQVIE